MDLTEQEIVRGALIDWVCAMVLAAGLVAIVVAL